MLERLQSGRLVLTDPLKFWVMTRVRLPENVMGLRYQTSETAACKTALVFSFGVSWVADMATAATAVVANVGESDSALGFITDPGFKSGL